MNTENKFWIDYIEADDEIQRHTLVKKLPIWDENNFCTCMTPTLLNSYLEDLLKAIGCFGYDEKKIPNGSYTNILNQNRS